MFVFINHAAKAADYIRNNQCDILNAFFKKKRRREKMKNGDSLPPRGMVIHGALTDQMIGEILFVKAHNYIFKQR